MEDVFGELPPEGQASHKGEPEQQQPAAQEPQQPSQDAQPQQHAAEGEPQQGAAPPAAETPPRHVPVETLEAVRKDYKGKADRLEGELQAIRDERDRLRAERDQRARQPADQLQEELTPEEWEKRRQQTITLDLSEHAARQMHGTEVVDKAWQRVQQEFQQNPALYQQIVKSANPWNAVVQHGKRLAAMDEIGTDPDAYRKKVEEEVKAQLAAATGGAPTQSAAPRLPESLAGARSAGARGTTWTGPAPFETLFPN